MSSFPIVAVSAAIRRDPDSSPVLRLRATYLSALENARLVPLAVPPMPALERAHDVLAVADALLLTGGEDVDPARYGEAPHPRLGTVSQARDAWEIALVNAARERNLPVLAICRGAQILNVALGGTLIQDIPSEIDTGIDHDPDRARTERTHTVEVAAESKLARAIGVTRLEVNSVHHQAVRRVAPSLRVVATAPDGVIEGVETAPDDPWWCVGVQWHPEDTVASGAGWDRMLFDSFGAVAGAAR